MDETAAIRRAAPANFAQRSLGRPSANLFPGTCPKTKSPPADLTARRQPADRRGQHSRHARTFASRESKLLEDEP